MHFSAIHWRQTTFYSIHAHISSKQEEHAQVIIVQMLISKYGILHEMSVGFHDFAIRNFASALSALCLICPCFLHSDRRTIYDYKGAESL